MPGFLYQAFIISFFFLFNSPAFAVTDTFTNAEDSYARSTSPTKNYGSETVLLADGVSQDPDTGTYGEIVTIVQWDISSIPASATVTGASVSFNYTNNSSGVYNFYSQDSAWSEATVDWNDLDQGPTVLATVPPFTSGVGISVLNASGVALVQGWVDGSIPNNGLILRTGGTNNGIVMDSNESQGSAPTLEVTYTTNGQTLEERVAYLENLLANVTRNGSGIHFTGVNVHIENGLGATNGNPGDPDSNSGTVNGLGNLIVGYNEHINPYNGDGTPATDKSGSHNVVIGHGHNYTSFGGLVVAKDNWINAPYTSVSGGFENTATSASYASVSGGFLNTASGELASVSGGAFNNASGLRSSVSGGQVNSASGISSSVSGGEGNTASGGSSSISGGAGNSARGQSSSVSGGERNIASGEESSISGGFVNNADGGQSSVSGGQNNTASGLRSSVSGGLTRTAPGGIDWVAGSLFEDN